MTWREENGEKQNPELIDHFDFPSAVGLYDRLGSFPNLRLTIQSFGKEGCSQFGDTFDQYPQNFSHLRVSFVIFVMLLLQFT